MVSFSLSDYAQAISLYDNASKKSWVLSVKNESILVEKLLLELQSVLVQTGISNYQNYALKEKRALLDAAITVLPPNTLSDASINALDELLQIEMSYRKLFDAKLLANTPFLNVGGTKVVLWQGDITTLKVDAIVNAANSQMLGCFKPMHKCIDNVIHNRAGIEVRNDCQKIMMLQGHNEQTGAAKITRAYNLPSNYIIHTVGPIIQSKVDRNSQNLLASCYNSILDIANRMDTIKSIALCSISTGVFGYPVEQAATIAIDVVCNWLEENTEQLDTVVFNVFSENDHNIYQSLLEERVCQ
jgi:O-acetyl-ADP-ribose deacetylase (regulator of RNase III)